MLWFDEFYLFSYLDCWALYQDDDHLYQPSMMCVFSESNCIDNIGGLLLKDNILYEFSCTLRSHE